MANYTIDPERRTLHGHFSRDLAPVLTIESGDTVAYRTLDAAWGLEQHNEAGTPRQKFAERIQGPDDGHALCGPIAINGARPGMTLEVQIQEVRPAAWGWCLAGGWSSATNRRLRVTRPPVIVHRWTLDPDGLVGRNQHGHTIALRPFMGVMGMPPDEPGQHSTAPPRPTGGNMDCKELVAGSTLYLPIAVAGGLFSVGDGHAVQGDGEVSGLAIECPMERVVLTFRLRDDLPLTTPRAETPAGWITLGFNKSLNEATGLALNAMLDLMDEQYGLSRRDALALASLAVDLRITQIVNGVRGVHALLPHGAISVSEKGEFEGAAPQK